MKKIAFLVVIIFTLTNCKSKVKTVHIDQIPELTKSIEVDDYKRPCMDSENYIPDEYTEKRTIRVNFHWINNEVEDANYKEDEGKIFLGNLLSVAKKKLTQNQKMYLPVGNDTPVLDLNYDYKITGLTKEDDGFYYHIDMDHYYYMDRGRHKNNYSRAVIEKYAIADDSIMNIFAISHPQDSLKSKKYRAHSAGIALGTSLKVTGLFSKRKTKKAWHFAALLNHEIGHILGLAHAWTRYDGCDDTPIHPNCYDGTVKGKCDGTYSNNVMDYNNQQNAFTPCQLGKIHKGFSVIGTKTRGLIIEDWCEAIHTDSIYISDNVEWKGERDLRKTIVIEKGGRLDIHCRLSMAEGTKIIVQEGAQLHLHRYSKLHNSCGDTWDGIDIMTNNEIAEQLFIYGEAQMLDVKPQNIVDQQL